jgi:hypothetical protein
VQQHSFVRDTTPVRNTTIIQCSEHIYTVTVSTLSVRQVVYRYKARQTSVVASCVECVSSTMLPHISFMGPSDTYFSTSANYMKTEIKATFVANQGMNFTNLLCF